MPQITKEQVNLQQKDRKPVLSLLFPCRLSMGFFSQQSCSRVSGHGGSSLECLPSEIFPAFLCCPGPRKIGWPLLNPSAFFLELAWVMFAEYPLILKLPVPVEG